MLGMLLSLQGFRDFNRIGIMENIDNIIILADKKCMVRLYTAIREKTYKSAASDEYILGIRKKTQVRRQSLLIISKSGEIYRAASD